MREKENIHQRQIEKMNLELLCVESDTIPSAIFDSAIVDDDRTLSNLITIEERYLITGSYFKCLQTDLTSSNRCELATWMLEVSVSI